MTERWFRRLLRLYPREFRQAYGDEIVAVFEHLRADADVASLPGRVRFVWNVGRDFLVTLIRAWTAAIWRGSRSREAPRSRSGLTDRVGQDGRYALRTLIQRPGFTLVVVVTLALGIGANTAIFTLVNEVLLRSLPIGDPSSVVDVFADNPGDNSFSGFSYPNFADYRDRTDVLDDLAAYSGTTVRVGADQTAEPVTASFTSANYFDVLGVVPVIGRSFAAEERVEAGGEAAAVLSYGFWQRTTAADPSVLGSTLRVNGIPFTVIGIAPEEFTGTFIGFPMEMWLSLAAAPRALPNFDLTDRGMEQLELIGRLRPGRSVSQAQAAFDLLSQQLEEEHPVVNRGRGVGIVLTTGVDHSMRSGVSGFLGVLMAVTGLVLLVTCLNVGGMLLARSSSRQREIAIRVAMGAGRVRVVRQLLTETIVLFGLGALGAVLVGMLATDAMLLMVAAVPIPLGFDLSIDWRVLTFTAVVTLLAAIAAGVSPARDLLRRDPISALRMSGGAGSGDQRRHAGRLRGVFVVAQITGAVVLMSGAGLFLRSLERGLNLDPGFEADRVAVATLTLETRSYMRDRGLVFVRDLARRVELLPDVEGAAIASVRPIGVGRSPMEISVPGFEPSPESDMMTVDVNAVTSPYFGALGIPVLEGRGLRPADAQGDRVAVINATMAARFWPGRGAVGQQFEQGGEPVRVVGVVADSRYLIQDDIPIPYMYIPFEQGYVPRFHLLIRSDRNLLELRTTLQAAIDALDPGLGEVQLTPLRADINRALLPQRVAASVTGALGGFALLLASLGVYGILAYAVASRRREIGIRLAVGSRPSQVVRLVIAQGMRLVGVGIVLGTGLSLLLAPLLRGFLVGVEPVDLVTLVAVPGLFLSVALLACAVPGFRAARVDPTQTLRVE